MTVSFFPTRARTKEVLSLAFPIIAGLGSQNIMNLADAMMVGRLDAASLAAVGVSAMFLWMVASPFQGLSHAVQTITARRLGEGLENRLHQALTNGFYLTLVLGIPYALLLLLSAPHIFDFLDNDPAVRRIGSEYVSIRLYTMVFIGFNYCFRGWFNGRNKPMVFMKALLLMHPLNILLNYLLIFGVWGFPEMGAQGAALGTAISTVVGSLYLGFIMFRHKTPGFSLKLGVLKVAGVKTLLTLAGPNGLQYLTLSSGFLAFYVIAGMVSTDALAATNILVNLSRVCFIMAVGLGMATITLVSRSLGEGRPEEARRSVHTALFLGCSILGLAGGLLSLFPQFWLGFFGVEPSVHDLALAPLVLVGLIQSYDAAAIILSHALLGGGASRRVMLVSVVNQWGVFLPACYIWIQFFDGGLMQLWICLAVYRFLLFLSFAGSFRGEYWKKV